MDGIEIDLTDEERAVLEPLLPPPGTMGRPCELDMREDFKVIQFTLGTGCQWRTIPKCFPPLKQEPEMLLAAFSVPDAADGMAQRMKMTH